MKRKQKDELWNHYMYTKSDTYKALFPDKASSCLISEANWRERAMYGSCEEFGMEVKPGDICYMDFGQAYLNEIGFQHFGLIMSVYRKKALVVPMTSNTETFARAFDERKNPNGCRHLMQIGMLPGMARPSVLFLNDVRYVNTARVIDIKAHLETDSSLFREIQRRMALIMFDVRSEEHEVRRPKRRLNNQMAIWGETKM